MHKNRSDVALQWYPLSWLSVTERNPHSADSASKLRTEIVTRAVLPPTPTPTLTIL